MLNVSLKVKTIINVSNGDKSMKNRRIKIPRSSVMDTVHKKTETRRKIER